MNLLLQELALEFAKVTFIEASRFSTKANRKEKEKENEREGANERQKARKRKKELE